MKRFSLRTRLVAVPIITLLIMGAVGLSITTGIVNRKFTEEAQLRRNREIDLIHEFIQVAQQKALENYLKGIADDLRVSVNSIYAAHERDAINEDQALRNVRVSLSSRVIGESGYVYVIDSQGTIRYHPHLELMDLSLDQHEFIQRQISLKEGYIEYQWANPDDVEERAKALYMTYFEPWDWIISVTAYKADFPDLVDISDLRVFLYGLNTEYETTFILDGEGRYLLHPHREGHIIQEFPDHDPLAQAIRDQSLSGKIALSSDGNRENDRRSWMAMYSYIPYFDWYVVSEVDQSATRKVVWNLIVVMSIVSLSSLLATALVLYVMGRSISSPIMALHSRLIGETPDFDEARNPDEISRLTLAFEIFEKKLREDRRLLANVARFVDGSPMPILRISDDWICRFSNTAAEQSIVPVLVDEERRIKVAWREILKDCMENRSTGRLSIEGTDYLANASEALTEDETYLALLDISDSKRYETLLSIWHGMFDHSIEGITITDEEGVVERVNESFSRITGYSEKEIVGNHTRLLKSGVHDDAFYTEMWETVSHEGFWSNEVWNRRKDGEIYPEWLAITAFTDSLTQRRKYMAIFHDISRIKEQERTISRMRSRDSLTDLPNREQFIGTLARALDNKKKDSGSIAVIVLDLDGFAWINESFGLPSGDSVLRVVAERLGATLRTGDVLARIGGDEFGIILNRLDESGHHREVMDRIFDVFALSFQNEEKHMRLSASGGLALTGASPVSAEELFARAQAALRRAKSVSPGDYVVFDDSQDSGGTERLELELALREALPKKELFLVYQPIVRAEDGKVESFEALLRWKQGNHTIRPDRFIPIAEKTGLVIPIGRWILGEACRFVSKNGMNDAPKIAVNISARQFADPSFQEELAATIKRYQVPAHRIGLEITENIAADVSGTAPKLKAISASGHRISIDDFGTGYSSLQYIGDFAFDVMKIDKSFVDGLLVSENAEAIIKAIISMGHSLGKTLVAEGVETEEQFNRLKDLGCDAIQGYYFSKPLEANDAVEFWQTYRPFSHQ